MTRDEARDLILCEAMHELGDPRTWQYRTLDERAILTAAFTDDHAGGFALRVERAELRRLIRDHHTPQQAPPYVPIDCPSWCTLEPGHPYDQQDHAGNLQRIHLRHIANGDTFDVDLEQDELSASDAGPIDRQPLRIVAWINGDPAEIAMPDDARVLADALTRAADLWDSIER